MFVSTAIIAHQLALPGPVQVYRKPQRNSAENPGSAQCLKEASSAPHDIHVRLHAFNSEVVGSEFSACEYYPYINGSLFYSKKGLRIRILL
jgi:hypothetical protein